MFVNVKVDFRRDLCLAIRLSYLFLNIRHFIQEIK